MEENIFDALPGIDRMLEQKTFETKFNSEPLIAPDPLDKIRLMQTFVLLKNPILRLAFIALFCHLAGQSFSQSTEWLWAKGAGGPKAEMGKMKSFMFECLTSAR